jgi:putative nucleotidyltransferase with HDIG domain
MIPSVRDCLKFMDTYQMLDNIRAHSIVVERVARVIARGLREAGVALSLEKVAAGALLHDIGKTSCLRTGGDHAAEGAQICLRHHLDEIVDIVAEHVRLKRYEPDAGIGEKEVIYYSDKRVNHDRVVSLEDRLDYILRRYGNNQDHLGLRIRQNFEICRRVEEKLFANLGFRPQDLEGLIGAPES